jgi:hypothetical protein
MSDLGGAARHQSGARARHHRAGAERARGEPRITLDALIATRHSILDLTPILREAQAGEQALLETDKSRAVFETLLNDDGKSEESKAEVPLPKPKPKWNWRPGHRKPHRDPVGIPQ